MPMPRIKRAVRRKRHPPAGSIPGTLVIHEDTPPVRIHVMTYSPAGMEECDVSDAATLKDHLHDDRITWIDVHGHGDEPALRSIADQFRIHPLALEDVTNVPQRPKIEVFDEQTFLVARMVRIKNGMEIDREQVSMFVSANYVLTFQERHGDVFEPVRTRIRQGGPVLRSSGSEYLAYALLDSIIDGYFPVLEMIGDHLEDLENEVAVAPSASNVQAIFAVKRELLALRRAMWPMREMLSTLMRDETPFITDKVEVHLRDCYDHCIQIIDVVETYREMASSLMDLHLAGVASRQNDVMKTLTIMASIFIPLTFMAGIYGMNFENMPELHQDWAYPALLGLMAVVTGGMVIYFRAKGWIGGGHRKRHTKDRR